MKLTLLFLILFPFTILASDEMNSPIIPSAMTPEERESMALAHEKMSVCLRSDKSLDVCHKELMETCSKVMGNNGCHMKNMYRMNKEKIKY